MFHKFDGIIETLQQQILKLFLFIEHITFARHIFIILVADNKKETKVNSEE